MNQFTSVKNKIQETIIDKLFREEIVSFTDLSIPRVASNLLTYHLKRLEEQAVVKKVTGGYTLGTHGLSYVDRVSAEKKLIQIQPKIITMLLIQNSDGDVLLQKRNKQPFINTWTLPYGKIHIDDTSVEAAGMRAAFEKLGIEGQQVTHSGDCYIRVRVDGKALSTTLAHICRFNADDISTTDTIVWARPHRLQQYKLAPAVETIMTRGFFNDPFFFEQYDEEWVA